MTSFYLAYMLK